MVWHRWNSPIYDPHKQGNHVIVVCNWSSSTYATSEILNIPRNGRWYEWLNNDKEYLVVNNKLIIDNLIDHTVRIFIYEVKKSIEEKYSSD
jgi:hypothetical protein